VGASGRYNACRTRMFHRLPSFEYMARSAHARSSNSRCRGGNYAEDADRGEGSYRMRHRILGRHAGALTRLEEDEMGGGGGEVSTRKRRGWKDVGDNGHATSAKNQQKPGMRKRTHEVERLLSCGSLKEASTVAFC